MNKVFVATITAVSLAFPIAAQAQDVPSYAVQQYAEDQNIHGRVIGFDGAYDLSVQDERGYTDNIELHPDTVISPIGLTIAPGMVVSVLGYNAGSYFSVNEIDTPYQVYNDVPFYAGHPWDFYGPTIGLDFFFGNADWWHGGSFHGNYTYVGGARAYNSVHVSDVYRANRGQFQGRNFVAPAAHGGYYGPAHAPSAHQASSGRDGHESGERH